VAKEVNKMLICTARYRSYRRRVFHVNHTVTDKQTAEQPACPAEKTWKHTKLPNTIKLVLDSWLKKTSSKETENWYKSENRSWFGRLLRHPAGSGLL